MRILLVFIISSFTSLAQVESDSYEFMLDALLQHTVPEVAVSDALSDDVLFIDCREWNEFEVSHIEGALWVGYNDFKADRIAGISMDQSIIIYCSVGYRSEKIAEQLVSLGYNDVRNLYGGIFEWVNQDKIIVDQNGDPSLKIHAYDRIWGIWLDKGEKVYY